VIKAQVAGISSEAFADRVDCRYQAAIGRDAWPAFLHRFANALHGHNTALFGNDLAFRRNQAAACLRTGATSLTARLEIFLMPTAACLKRAYSSARESKTRGDRGCGNKFSVRQSTSTAELLNRYMNRREANQKLIYGSAAARRSGPVFAGSHAKCQQKLFSKDLLHGEANADF